MKELLPELYTESRGSDLLTRGMEFFRNLFNKQRRSRVAFWDLIERAEDHLRLLDARNQQRWGLGHAPRQFDTRTGVVTFGAAGDPILTAQAQVVGTLSHGQPLWRWAWDSSLPALLTRSAHLARTHGERHRILQLTSSRFGASIVEAWGLVALTCLLSQAEGAYCEQTERGLVFFVFHCEALPEAHAAPLSRGV